jgi:Mrp family chromosome partitioning ATPase
MRNFGVTMMSLRLMTNDYDQAVVWRGLMLMGCNKCRRWQGALDVLIVDLARHWRRE